MTALALDPEPTIAIPAQARRETVVPVRQPLAAAAATAPIPTPITAPITAPIPTTTTSGPSAEAPADGPIDQSSASILDIMVSEVLTGVPGARDRLLAELLPLVLRYCRGRLGRQETVAGSADDVAQEVCLAVVTALPSYQLKGLSFRAFVYGIAAHKVTDAFRAIGRNRCDPVADLPDSPVLHDGPEQRLLAQELTQRLGGLLHRLTPRQREVLVLRIAVGLSAEETAAAVGSTPGAVRVTQHRALNRLRGELTGPHEPADHGLVDDADAV